MATPRVIFVNRVYWPNESATAQLLTDLAEALAARGWEVHVICAGTQTERNRCGVTIHRSGHASEHRGLLHRARGYASFLRFARRMLRGLARNGDVVVVKTDPPLLAAAVTTLTAERGARVVQWIQDIYPEIAREHAGAWLQPLLAPLRMARDAAWQRAAFCVPVGGDMKLHVERHGVPANRVVVLPNWAPCELDRAPATEAVAARRAALGWTDKFAVVYSGNLGRVHEFRTLLDAAERLRDHPNIVFAFIGGGARWPEVSRAVATRKLTNVQLLPPQPRADLAVSLAAADVHAVTLIPCFESLVHPSKISGALAVARPIAFVGPPASSLACFLAEQNCGATVAPGEDAALAQLLERWQSNAAERTHLGLNARRAYQQHLRFGSLVTRWDTLLRAAAAGTTLPTEPTAG